MSEETIVKALESIIGRLNHAAYIIPLSHHFLNRLRSRLERMSPNHPNQTFRLMTDEIKDAELRVTFLAQTRAGISLNCLTLGQPSQGAISDSFPFGLGGSLCQEDLGDNLFQRIRHYMATVSSTTTLSFWRWSSLLGSY